MKQIQFFIAGEWTNWFNGPVDTLNTANNLIQGSIAASKHGEIAGDASRWRIVEVPSIAPTSSHFEQLEAIMDQSSVDQMLLKMSRICYEKSEHIESNWQDKVTARVWRRAAAKLARIGGKVGC